MNYFVLSLSVLFSYFAFGNPVEQGSIDFNGWRFDRPISLSGQWRSKPGLVQSFPQDFEYAVVPGSFKDSVFEELRSGIGEKSYFILLKNLPGETQFGLRFRVDTSARVLFGKQGTVLENVGEVGRISGEKSKNIPEVADKVISFSTAAAGDYILGIQVQNQNYHSGGIWRGPLIDTYEATLRAWNFEQVSEFFAFGIIIILTAYNFALYFQRREDPSNLYLAGFCLFALLRFVGVSGFLSQVFFDEPIYWVYWLSRRFEFGTIPLSASFLSIFLLYNFAPGKFPRWPNAMIVFSIAHFLVTLLVSDQSLHYLIYSADLMILTATFFVFYCAIKGLRDEAPGAVIYLLGMVIFALATFNDLSIGLGFSDNVVFLGSYGFCALMFSQGQVVAKQFARAFRTSEHLSKHLEHEVEAKTMDISTMLDNIPHGILAIYSDGRLGERSKHLENILETNQFKDKTLRSILLDKSNLTEEQKSMIESALSASIGEIDLGYETNEVHLVKEMEVDFNSKQKILECTWAPVYDKNRIVEKVLLVLKDNTEVRKFKQESLDQKKELEFIVEIIKVPKDKFSNYIMSSQSMLADNRRLIEANEVFDPEVVKILFVNLHTIKGAARTLGFAKMTGIFHDAEQKYANLLKGGVKDFDRTDLLKDQKDLEAILEKYRFISEERLGRKLEAEGLVLVERTLLNEQSNLLKQLSSDGYDGKNGEFIKEMRHRIDDIIFSSVDECFQDILSNVNKVAKDLSKEPPVIKFDSISLGLNEEGRKLLTNIFTHVIRNSMDHGIETAEERISSGKMPTGKISISLGHEGHYVKIRYSDDGRGLNLNEIRNKSLQMDDLQIESTFSDYDIAMLIFEAGMTTAHTISQFSGRGVGMGAIKQYLEECGGLVDLQLGTYTSRDGVPFILILKIPDTFFTSPDESNEAI